MKMKTLIKKFTPKFILDWYHFGLVLIGALVYRWPARKLKIIGVTGTNGKSTVVYLTSRILEGAGHKTAAISSVQFKIGDRVWPNTLKMTMPGRFKVQKFMRQAVIAGCRYLVLEVTSEGIRQHRHKFIGFDTAILTNVTPEHIESHGGFDNYKRAKGKLFQSIRPNGKMIINLDDEHAGYFLQFPTAEKWGYGIKRKSWENIHNIITAENIHLRHNGSDFQVNGTILQTNLLGEFNVSNALAAITAGVTEKISLDKISSVLKNIKGIPGRLEMVIHEPFTVMVDYAHTPDALEKVYQTLRKVFNGRLISVLGSAGGGRDKWKRPAMGRIADQYCDQIIVTNEDPYDEDPQIIMEEVASEIKNHPAKKIIDRREAIREALQSAQEGDIVIITGKGCESWMCLAGGQKTAWDDREIVREEFKEICLKN